MMRDDEKSVKFRQEATKLFQLVVNGLIVLLIGFIALGWWIGRWWGLAIGATIGCLIFAVGVMVSGLLYAMSQDGA